MLELSVSYNIDIKSSRFSFSADRLILSSTSLTGTLPTELDLLGSLSKFYIKLR